MTTTRVFKSTDPGAPVLTGQVGSGIAWLKACLVGTAGVAYGTGADEKLSAGWTIPFEDPANNICCFQNSVAAGGMGGILRVDDNGTGTGGAREMLIRAYRTMSDVNTGTDPTPTVAQSAGGMVFRKSTALSSAPREWVLLADELTVSANTHPGNVSAVKEGHYILHAGDYDCDDPTQPCPFLIAGSKNQSSTAAGSQELGITGARGTSTPGIYIMRGTSHAVGAETATVACLTQTGSSPVGGSAMPFPNPMAGSGLTVFHPAFITNSTTLLGKLRGVFLPIQNISADEMGTLYPSPSGLDPASVLMSLIHQATPAGQNGRGHVAVETVLEW